MQSFSVISENIIISHTLASCLIYARALLGYVIIIWWRICNYYVVTLFFTMLPSVDFAE